MTNDQKRQALIVASSLKYVQEILSYLPEELREHLKNQYVAGEIISFPDEVIENLEQISKSIHQYLNQE